MMARVLLVAGMMARSEHSCHSQANSSMLSMMLTIMVSLLYHQLTTVKELYQVAWKVKLEFGELESKLRLWRLH
jgi:hypothetical protein